MLREITHIFLPLIHDDETEAHSLGKVINSRNKAQCLNFT